jgi:hypothetical protein
LPWQEIDDLTTILNVMYRIQAQGKDVCSKGLATAIASAGAV